MREMGVSGSVGLVHVRSSRADGSGYRGFVVHLLFIPSRARVGARGTSIAVLTLEGVSSGFDA